MDTVVNENRVRVDVPPYAGGDGEDFHTLADELFEKSAFAPTFEEGLQKVLAAKRPEDMRSLTARLHRGSFDRLFGKEPEKCKALKELVAAKLSEVTWESIFEAIKQVENSSLDQLKQMRERFVEHWILHHEGSDDEVSLYSKEQIDLLFKAIMSREQALGIGTA